MTPTLFFFSLAVLGAKARSPVPPLPLPPLLPFRPYSVPFPPLFSITPLSPLPLIRRLLSSFSSPWSSLEVWGSSVNSLSGVRASPGR